MSSPETSNICSECKHTFGRFGCLRKHVKKFHPEKLEEIAPLKLKSYPFHCPDPNCKRNFSYKRHLDAHLRIHSDNKTSSSYRKNINFGRKCPLCNFVAKLTSDFYIHFRNEHRINVEFERWIFLSQEEFKRWLTKTEKETQSKFVINNTCLTNKATVMKYICHRSGFFHCRSTGKRHLKKGSRKINGFCPAGLHVLVDKENKNLKVTFVKTHVGHQNDLRHLVLSQEERHMLAAKIAKKIPFDTILDDIRNSVSETSPGRLHLLTKKDLFNIRACFNLQSTSQEHSNDANEIVEDPTDTDSQVHVDCVSNTSEENQEALLEERKKSLIDKILADVNNIDSENELEVVEKLWTRIGPKLRALKHKVTPPPPQKNKHFTIKKIAHQQRLFSTQKNKKKPTKHLTEPT